VGQQKALTETTTGAYAMLSGQFINNRLNVVAGVRQEEKSRKGHGPFVDGRWNYAKLPDGKLYRDSVTNGTVLFNNASFLSNPDLIARMKAAGVTVPDHVLGPTGSSLESAKLNRIPLREVNQKIRNEPSPSLSSSFALTKKIDLKAAWSKTFKLPALEDTTQGLVSGNNAFNITESDTIPADGTLGTISVANPGLLPEISTNWDFQVAYYTDTGGKLAVSYFTKSVTNQAQTISIFQPTSPELFAAVLTALELDPASYEDWRLTTSTNSSSVQKTHGFEYEASQNLAFLGGWARRFQVFASYTMNSLGQPATLNPVTIESPNGTPITLTPTVKTIALRSNRFASAGIQFATRRFSAQVRGTYKNRNERTGDRVTMPNGNFLRRFEPSTTRIDLNFAYELSKNYSLFLSGKDVFNGTRKEIIRDDLGLLPAYAEAFDIRDSGVTWTFGVNGRW
jgi:outer membrane receptor protein involved in Fe transport